MNRSKICLSFSKVVGPLTSMLREAHELDHWRTQLCQVMELRTMRLTSLPTGSSENSTPTVIAIIVEDGEVDNDDDRTDETDEISAKSKNIKKSSKVRKYAKARHFGTTYLPKLQS